MKKNGFTLVELIATIGLLGMLATILITVSVRKINESKEYSRDTMIESIELAAQEYVMDHKDELTDFNKYDYIYITLQTLVEKEYFTNSIVDPTTNKSLPLSDEVYVVRESNGKITATYDINQRKRAKLVLNGAYNEYLKKGETFTDLGITATSENETDVSSEVTITGTVDTSAPGTYTITYEYDDVTITRNIIVYDGKLPFAEVKPITGADTIAAKVGTGGLTATTATYTNTDNESVTVDAGIRYVGASDAVANKVYFNCEATDGTNAYGTENYKYDEACETWRIIGVFDVEDGSGNTEKRMKIINTESTFIASWDSSASSGDTANSGFGINQWGASTKKDGSSYAGADLMQLLNGYYIGKSGSECKYNNTDGQTGFGQTCTTESLVNTKMKPLTSNALSMIEEAVWYTYSTNSSTAATAYLQERGITQQYVGNSLCTAGTTYCNDKVNRTKTWTGLVGLMSVSDIGYANGWLYNPSGTSLCPWAIAPNANSFTADYVWYSGSSSVYYGDASGSGGVWPSIILKSNIQITGGDGLNTPYKLSA